MSDDDGGDEDYGETGWVNGQALAAERLNTGKSR
jgi:hypothetical protein